jgi:CRP-like cAMP-binding protein
MAERPVLAENCEGYLCSMANEGENKDSLSFDHAAFIAQHGSSGVSKYESGQLIYAQGDPADALYYIVSGSVKETVISEQGKEGVLAILRQGGFFGERCLAGRDLHRNKNTFAASASEIVKFDRNLVQRALEEDTDFLKLFLRIVLDRNRKTQEYLVDQLFYPSEKRLARILLSLAHKEIDANSSLISVPVTQETLASMVGTTRSRINQFMTKFRKLGYIDYDEQIRVHNSLLNIILDDRAHDFES